MNQIQEVSAVLNKHKVNYWLDGGTLLGHIREGGFISWDKDLDLCVKEKDFKQLKPALKELSKEYYIKKTIAKGKIKGYGFYPKSKKNVRGALMVLRNEGTFYVGDRYTQKLDFRKKIPRSKKIKWYLFNALYALNPVNFFHVVLRFLYDSEFRPKWDLEKFPLNKSYKKTGTTKRYSKYIKEFIIVNGARVPKKYKKYLESMYGKDWKIPKKDWPFSENPLIQDKKIK